jgi:transcriptional regulator with XRE-family HTH domain
MLSSIAERIRRSNGAGEALGKPAKPKRATPSVNARVAAAVDGDVPRRLRAERERRNISVRELARRLQVSPSAISQIERGIARPSVATLYAIVAELGLSLDELFAHRPESREASSPPPAATTSDRPHSPIVTEASRVAIELGTGVRWERLTADPDPEVDFLHVVYEVGGCSSPDGKLMRHPGHEYGLVLSGKLEVTVQFDTYVLTPGESISFDSTTPHRLRNVGDEPMCGVWIVIGRRASPAAQGDRS